MSDARKGPPTPATSPWGQHFEDYVGQAIDITVIFDEGDRSITSASIHRDAECLFTTIFIGLGPDETPNTSPVHFEVPTGTTPISAGVLSLLGFNVIEEIEALQISAGTLT